MSKIILFIACSLDGYIARPDGDLDWLNNLPNPENTDHGYNDFLATISSIIMGRKTYSEVLGFGIGWPYKGINTYIASNDEDLKVPTPDTERIIGDIDLFTEMIKMKQKKNIWLAGGGQLVTYFLNHNLIDRMIISIIPLILGEGIPLFPNKPEESSWVLAGTETFSTGVVSLTYNRA
jgi:dihydrofolate reductase